MFHRKKLLSIVLALALTFVMVGSALAEAAPVEAASVEATAGEKPLVYGITTLSGKFSPFFATSGYDVEVMEMTQAALMVTDRLGAPVMNGIEGEVHPYNGVDYKYTGPADLVVDFNKETNLTTYTAKLRDDLKFSDGTPVTIDDVIFSMYVFCDPAYDSSSTLYSTPIVGIQNYRTQTTSDVYAKYSTLAQALVDAGDAHEWAEGDTWTKEQQDWFKDTMKQYWTADAQSIVDYVQANYAADAAGMLKVEESAFEGNDGLKVAAGMALWGYGTPGEDGSLTSKGGKTWTLKDADFPTIDDYYNELYAAYAGDANAYWTTEGTGETDNLVDSVKNAFISYWGPQDEAMSGGIPNIEGIKRIDDYTVEVTTVGFDAKAIYNIFGTYIAPLHYYGDPAQYDYANNKFGFPYGDLSGVKAKTDIPLGMGPYVLKSYENKVVFYEANENYYKGAPKTKYIQFKETLDADKISGVQNGTLDVTDPSLSQTAADEIGSYNGNGELKGDKIFSTLVDNLGYGYMGFSAKTMSVAGEPGSAASKNLRKGFATILSVYRDVAMQSFYGDRASVINYPISNTSWAAPQKSDEGYRVAYSTDVDGKDIFTSDMTVDQKVEAAKAATIGFFKAAGYTFDEATGKFTAAPEGAKLEYELIIPGDGVGNHPSFQIVAEAKAALEAMGITLTINDPADSNVLWNKFDANTQEMWCAAWQATIDPDMYQTYSSSGIQGAGGSDSNHYNITDPELDKLMDEARTSDDQSFRKSTYKLCLDIILDWGVELPVYQRQNVVIFSPERVNMATVTPDITTFWGWQHDLELLEMK